MATSIPPIRTGLTYDEWLRLPRSTQPQEVLDGVLVMAPAPSSEHQWLLSNVWRSLDAFVRSSSQGVLLPAPVDVIIRKEPALRTRQPDLAWWGPERGIRSRRDLQAMPAMEIAPDLVVEFLSPEERRRELAGKLQDYASIGVTEVWLISPEAETVELLRLQSGTYQRLGFYGTGDTLLSDLLPGFTLSVDTVFA